MGELYGKKIKFITAIASILLSVGYVAVQIKALIELFYSIGISKFVTRKIVNQNFENSFNKM